MNCNITISNLGRGYSPCKPLRSGVRGIYFAPRADVQSINAMNPAMVETFEDFVTIGNPAMGKAITVKKDKCFALLDCAKNVGVLTYTIATNRTGCRVFVADLKMFHYGFKKQILGFMAYANNNDFIFVVKLENGEYHLLGDLDYGAMLTNESKATSGKATTDQSGAALSFSCTMARPCIFYNGWLPTDPNNGLDIFEKKYYLVDENGSFITTLNNEKIRITD